MIKKSDRKIVKEQFGVEFYYNEINKVGYIKVIRINSDDLLQTIKFWDNDRLVNRMQFEDACITWCDRNAA